MPNAVVHFEIGAADAGKLREFYTALFGWRFDTTDPSYSVVDQTDGGVGGGIMQIREDMPAYVTVYVAVDDLSGTLARIKELGGAQVVGPTAIPGVGQFALFRDPQEHLIGLLELDRPTGEQQ